MSKDKLYIMRSGYTKTGLEEMIRYIGNVIDIKESTIIEIGAYAGESTEIFATKFKEVITIDPYVNDYDKNDAACQYMDLVDVYKVFQSVTSKYPNIKHIKKTSDEAFEELQHIKVDVVYIDGLHTYEQVKKDILNYMPMIKSNGFLSGHDYSEHWGGVVQAISETIGNPEKVFEDTSWIKKITN